jgi:hypothetical protein
VLNVIEENEGSAGRDATPTGAPLIVERPVIAPPASNVIEENEGSAGRDATPTGAPLIVESPVIAPPSVKSTEEMLVRSA